MMVTAVEVIVACMGKCPTRCRSVGNHYHVGVLVFSHSHGLAH